MTNRKLIQPNQRRPGTFGRRLNSLRGFTLTEAAIVLTVAVVIVGAVFSVSASIKERAETTNAINLMQTTASNMVNYMKSGYAPPTGNITTPMMNAKVIPEWAATTDSNGNLVANSPWGVNKFVMYYDKNNIGSRTIRLSFYDVPYGACLGLIMSVPTCTSQQAGCSSQIITKAGGYSVTSVGMTASGAATACNANSYNGTGNNSVEFDFLY